MTKKKGIASKLFLVLVALTLLSCCFLGTTFARYTSGGTGKATTAVAKWDIDVKNNAQSDETTVDFGKLSPSDDEFQAVTSADDSRKNSTSKTLVATITNSGEVAATITVAAGDVEITLKTAAEQETVQYDETGYVINASATAAEGDGASETQVKACFSAEVDVCNAEGVSHGSSTVTLQPNERLTVYATVTWTSQDMWGQYVSDAIDTWIGENVESVAYTFTYTAVQASERPAA